MQKKKIIAITMVIFTMLTGCASADSEVLIMEPSAASEMSTDGTEATEISPQQEEPKEKKPENIVVYVCGAVCEPGVYELSEGARIDDAVKAAGGFSAEADRTYVNLAAVLEDGVKLQIPTAEQVALMDAGDPMPSYDGGSVILGESQDADKSGLVNINTASAEELKTLPGIGDGIASRIIQYRSDNGSFKSIEDIMKVSGIKDKLFSKIKDRITV